MCLFNPRAQRGGTYKFILVRLSVRKCMRVKPVSREIPSLVFFLNLALRQNLRMLQFQN